MVTLTLVEEDKSFHLIDLLISNMSESSFIFTGPREIGKSMLCWKILKYLETHSQECGGVITLQNSQRWFYLVSTHEKLAFEAKGSEAFIPIGQYKIHKENLMKVLEGIRKSIDSKFFFLDEIGFLELDNDGYFPVLDSVLSRENNNFLDVREIVLKDFLIKYPEISKYKIIKIRNRDDATYNNIIRQIDIH
ncbi:MAG: hypothetical protein JSV04_06415 [Candidatus Heimdallarchaeota archaeon]|nr:MAG: hypothetical protein JSV04_06415 [Candidatus Heimdallarchaeota archaeon]